MVKSSDASRGGRTHFKESVEGISVRDLLRLHNWILGTDKEYSESKGFAGVSPHLS